MVKEGKYRDLLSNINFAEKALPAQTNAVEEITHLVTPGVAQAHAAPQDPQPTLVRSKPARVFATPAFSPHELEPLQYFLTTPVAQSKTENQVVIQRHPVPDTSSLVPVGDSRRGGDNQSTLNVSGGDGTKVQVNNVFVNISLFNPLSLLSKFFDAKKFLEQGCKIKDSTIRVGPYVVLIYVAVIVFSAIWGFLLSHHRLFTECAYVQALNLGAVVQVVQASGICSIVYTLIALKSRPSVVFAGCFLACLLSTCAVSDQYVETSVPTRFNGPVYQSMQTHGSLVDPNYSIFDHMVEARKLSVCETAPLSPECQDVLEENRRVSQIGMLALRKTLEDKTIVEPVSVDLVWTRGPPTYVDFEETVYNAQVQEDEDQGARDLREVKYLALMAKRIKDGNHYFKEYRYWLAATQTQKNVVEWIREHLQSFGVVDFVLLGIFEHYWASLKVLYPLWNLMLEQVPLNIFKMEEVASWADKSKTVKHPNSTVDICSVDRCVRNYTSEFRVSSEYMRLYNKSAGPSFDEFDNQSCPKNLDILPSVMKNCALSVQKCIEGLDQVGSRMQPRCPVHCQNVPVLNDTYILRRCSNKSIEEIYDFHSRKGRHASDASNHTDDGFFTRTKRTVRDLVDTFFKISLGGGVMGVHGIRVLRRG